MGIPKAVRNTVISVVVLLVLLVGAGLAYTYFYGPTGGEVADTPKAEPAPTNALPKPGKIADNAPVGVSVAALLSPVAPGDNTSISIRTLPDAKCTIVAAYNNVPAADSGLAPKTADEFGTVAWTWKVSAAAPEGTWPVDVTCARNGKSGMVRGDLIVAKKTAE